LAGSFSQRRDARRQSEIDSSMVRPKTTGHAVAEDAVPQLGQLARNR
jgi:hypothetical protein